MLTFRKAVPQDEEALYAICLATGDAGKDASHLYADEKIVGNIYAVPYLHLCPDSAFVAEDGEGVCGYIVGATDTAAYEERLEQAGGRSCASFIRSRKKRPTLCQKNTASALPSFTSRRPCRFGASELPRPYPHEPVGAGSRYRWRFSAFVDVGGDGAQQEYSGIHLGANPDNHNGIAFWQSRGFSPLAGMPAGTAWFGMSLDA